MEPARFTTITPALPELMQTVFRDQRMLIRPFSGDDGPALFTAASESLPELCSWMTWCTPGYSLADAVTFASETSNAWRSGAQYCFAIVEAHTGTLHGSIGLTQVDRRHNFANVGVWVRTSSTRRGIAASATSLLAKFAFEELRLTRLEFLVAANNIASIRVAQKAGAKFEGVLRQRLRLAGQVHDALLYSLLATDTPPNPEFPTSSLP